MPKEENETLPGAGVVIFALWSTQTHRPPPKDKMVKSGQEETENGENREKPGQKIKSGCWCGVALAVQALFRFLRRTNASVFLVARDKAGKRKPLRCKAPKSAERERERAL